MEIAVDSLPPRGKDALWSHHAQSPDVQDSALKLDIITAFASLTGRRFSCGLLALSLLLAVLAGSAVAESIPPEELPRAGEIVANPQAAYTFAGWDQLGLMLGFDEKSGVRMGGCFINEFRWVASGGIRPNDTLATLSLAVHASIDTEQALNVIPGATVGVEFLECAGSSMAGATGAVQQMTTEDGPVPHSRQQLYQLWWHQRLFDDRLILHVGKMNGSGSFNSVQMPVVIAERQLQDRDISDLMFVPVGLNPTLFGRLPSYPNTGYGAVVHYAPTKEFYASYGIFDANGTHGVQTGLEVAPDFNGYYMQIGELGYSWRLGDQRKPGRIGVGGWYQSGELFTPALTAEDGATGFYLFANQRLWYKNPNVDEAGILGYMQFGHTGADTQVVKTYFGTGLTGLRLVPGRPFDQMSVGVAWSKLNDTPKAGAFFYPGVESKSANLGESELMFQAVYQTTFFFKMPRGFWTLTPVVGYTYIPDPGQRPDIPAAHVIALRLTTLF
jgi:porin